MRFYSLVAAFAAAAAVLTLSAGARAQSVAPQNYRSLHWREIGPLRGGRTASISGTPNDPNTFYIGVVNGGVWKTDDAGRTWNPIFDGQPTGSIGAVAVAWSDPSTIYAGSGEGLQRPDLSVGDGVYKSTDAGKTWRNVGLRDGQQIAGIAVDPHDAGRLFVAVLGHPYGPNAERGVFRSTDGGATWQKVLYRDENTGAYAVAIDPHDPQTVYATLWPARQAPWEIGASFELGGGALYKSTDGGTTWNQLTQGLPAHAGRTEIAIAPSNPQIVYVYADVEAQGDDNGALYRSDDAGAHFTKVDDAPEIAERGDDLVSIAVDPKDPSVVYLTNTTTYRSTDGGKTFAALKGAPGGDDYHGVWVDPTHPNVIGLVSDQGATISVNGGRTWSSWYNQPTAQMYHAFADDRFPYWVCGAQQESGSACVSSRGNWGTITVRDWHPVGVFEYGYVVEDPLDKNVFYGGGPPGGVFKEFDVTGQVQEVSPLVLPNKKYRAVRTLPLAFDHFDPKRLYFGTNVVFVTENGGHSWRAISPDLTREHPAVPGVIRAFENDDPAQGHHRGVVYALAQSYRRPATLWAGTDDGLVWITRDGGAHWKNVTPPALGPWSKIAQIDASRVDDDTAFVAVNRFRLDDLHPYVYVTHDGGAHWQSLANGLPNAPVNAVRQDPVQPALLYAATENGVHVSFNGGRLWQPLQLDLPHTSVRDLIVHGNDLVIATHGRGFWILDDAEPLRELAASPQVDGLRFFAPANAYRVRRSTNPDTPLPPEEPHGQNPPDGAIIDYALAAPAHRVTIAIRDASGRVVREYASDAPAPRPIPNLDKPAWWERPWQTPSTQAGMQRFVWDLREAAPRAQAQDLPISAVPEDTPRVPEGPLVPPGRYTVTVEADGRRQARTVTVVMDPRVHIAPQALQQQYDLARAVAAMMNRSFDAAAAARGRGDKKAATELAGMNDLLASLLDTIDGADAPPTTQAVAAVSQMRARLDRALAHP